MKDVHEIHTGVTPTGAPNTGGICENRDLDQYLAVSQKRCKTGT